MFYTPPKRRLSETSEFEDEDDKLDVTVNPHVSMARYRDAAYRLLEEQQRRLQAPSGRLSVTLDRILIVSNSFQGAKAMGNLFSIAAATSGAIDVIIKSSIFRQNDYGNTSQSVRLVLRLSALISVNCYIEPLPE